MSEMRPEEYREEVLNSIVEGSKIKLSMCGMQSEEATSFTVERFYPNYVLAINKLGFRACFSYWEVFKVLRGDEPEIDDMAG